MKPIEPVETIADFVELLQNSNIRLMMGALYTAPLHRNHSFYLQLAVTHEKLTISKATKNDSYGCVLGIFSYHLVPELLQEYLSCQTIDAEAEVFERIELEFLTKFNVDFKFSPFRLWHWPEDMRNKYFEAKSDKSRKKIATQVLMESIIDD